MKRNESRQILNHPIIAERYFFPRPESIQEPTLVTSEAGNLRGSWLVNDPANPTLVHFHGNAECVADYESSDLVQFFASLNLNCFLIEYRGSGGCPLLPLLADLLDDVGTFRDSLKSAGVEDSKLIVYGRSVGSLFALEWIQRFPDTAGLILESAVADVAERLLVRVDPAELSTSREALEAACDDMLNHHEKLTGYDRPALILHALHDRVVDVGHAHRLYQWSKNEKSQLVLLPRGNHNSIYADNREIFEETIRRYKELIFPQE